MLLSAVNAFVATVPTCLEQYEPRIAHSIHVYESTFTILVSKAVIKYITRIQNFVRNWET